MEAKIEIISELSKLSSIKARMSDDLFHLLREFGIRKGLKKLVISSKIRIFIGENQ